MTSEAAMTEETPEMETPKQDVDYIEREFVAQLKDSHSAEKAFREWVNHYYPNIPNQFKTRLRHAFRLGYAEAEKAYEAGLGID